MAFLIRYNNGAGNTVLRLSPSPTEVEYPEKRLFKSQPVRDGGVVRQRPLRDSRPRQWTWKGYRPVGPSMQNFDTLWTALEGFDIKARKAAGYATLTVDIWEDDTEEGGFGDLTSGSTPDLSGYTNMKWTTVEVQQVTRKTRKGGGPTVYDTALFEFVVVDSTYGAF